LIAAAALGCDCVQIFVKNQRQWRAKPLTQEQIDLFREEQRRTDIHPVLGHASYLLNLASPDPHSRQRSTLALIDELERCEAVGVPYLVLHPGSHLGAGMAAGINNVIASLNDVHGATRGFATSVLLEMTAGQGSSVGHEIQQMGKMIAGTRESERLGVCLDTCHLFAAGYDLSNPAAYEETISLLAACVGLTRIKCIHMNDSRGPCGSRVDRHEHIGKGKLGRQAFIHVVNDRRLAGVPKILETPSGIDGRGTSLDRVNLRRLRRMILA
ncbi:MAG TPA: deoxyribonuclease IV, partial [Phycisphaerae bacterium]|nr:deoxyribonuclease IV [Phycisphaerae bacterium]